MAPHFKKASPQLSPYMGPYHLSVASRIDNFASSCLSPKAKGHPSP